MKHRQQLLVLIVHVSDRFYFVVQALGTQINDLKGNLTLEYLRYLLSASSVN